jgi:glycosyltransferase involved in cell wall biosynthesis
MTDPASGLSILHVVVRAGPTNSQFNEHCLPVADTRRITVCSLFPADVTPPGSIRLVEGDGSIRGCFRAVDRALRAEQHDVVHVHAPASGMVVAATYMRRHRPRRDLMFTVHNSWQNFRLRNRLFLRFLIAFFPVVVACGKAAHDSIPAGIRRRRRDKLSVVRNGVDVARIDAVLESEPARTRPGPGLTVLSVGRLIPIKDPASVLTAYLGSSKPVDELVFVGDGPLRRSLEARARSRRPHAQVEFTGLIPRDQVYLRMLNADVFVSASRGEGLPVALLEAMAAGCPVVATDIPPHNEVAALAPGVRLVPVGDVEGLKRAVRRSLELSPEERSRLGAQMRGCVERLFSVDAMNAEYGRLYAGIAKHRTERGLRGESALPSHLLRKATALVLCTVLGGLAGWLVAEVQPPLYKGETTLMVGSPVGSVIDEDTLNTSAALAVTYADLARREMVLGPVAEQGFARDWRALSGDVDAETGEKNPQLVQLTAYAATRTEASRLAAAVADQLLAVARAGGTSPRSRFLHEQLSVIQEDIRRQSAALQRARAEAGRAGPDDRRDALARVDDLRSSLAELQGSYAELITLGSPSVADLTLVDGAWTARSPLRPTPLALVVAGAAIGFGLVAGWLHVGGRRRAPVPEGSPTGPTGDVRPMHPEPWAAPDRPRIRPSTSREVQQR